MRLYLWLAVMGAASTPVLSAQTTPPMPVQPMPPIAYPITPPSYNFGMVGVTSDQVMRVVVSNVATIPPTNTGPTPVPACGVSVKFIDAMGNVAGEAHTDTLAWGTSFDAQQTAASGHAEYRVQVQAVLPAGTNTTPVRFTLCNLISTLQVVDTGTNKTTLVLSGNPLVAGYYPVPLVGAQAAR